MAGHAHLADENMLAGRIPQFVNGVGYDNEAVMLFRFTKGTLKKKFAKKLREIDQTWQHYKTAELFLREKELKERNVI